MKRLRVTNVVLLMLCIMYFITYLDRTNVSTAAAGFAKDFGLDKAEIGLVFSAFAYPYLVFQIIGVENVCPWSVDDTIRTVFGLKLLIGSGLFVEFASSVAQTT